MPVLQSRWAIVAFVLLAMAPMAFVTAPPLVDAPGHLARWIVQVDHGASPVLRQWYDFRWGLVANLGCDLLAQALLPLIGPEPALRVIVALALGTQTAGILLLSRVVHRKFVPTALFALPFVYAFPFQFGFLNFWLGSGAALVALAGWIHLGRTFPASRRALIFVPVGLLLWICHLVALAVLVVGAFAHEVAQRHRAGGPAWRVLAGAGLALWPLSFGPLVGALFARHARVEPFSYHLTFDKLIWPVQVLRDSWQGWDMGAVLAAAIAIYLFWRSGRMVRDPSLALFAWAMLAIYVLIPDMIFEAQYADMRLVPLVFVLFLIAVRPADNAGPKLVAALTVLGLLVVGARWSGNAVSMMRHSAQFERTVAVLDRLPRGSNVVTLVPHRCGGDLDWDRNRRDHISGYALIRRESFDSRQWQEAAGQLLSVHNPAAAPFDREAHGMLYEQPCEGWPGVREAMRTIGAGVGWVWLVGVAPDFAEPGWRRVAASGDSVLLRRAP
ncbi:GtrA family protein [Novosphingobium huizhouense]|uniref:GtrA family protein n=1 Tax=Novosphingobium huizhouense TaxID=2866625 RepID=UPI001CD8F1E2|nr:GtrA family protein [Novosphingobium huizhouense]